MAEKEAEKRDYLKTILYLLIHNRIKRNIE